MRETPRERQYREEHYASRSTATRSRRQRSRRRNSGGTTIILLLFCALLIGGAVGTWKMAQSTAAASPPVSDTKDNAAEPPVQADPVNAAANVPDAADPAPDKEKPEGQEPDQTGTEPTVSNEPEPPTAEEPAAPAFVMEIDTTPPASCTQEELDAAVQAAIDEIITPDMTKMEQAKAVWDFAKNGIRYTGDSDKSDWKSGAYEGLTARRGDCFTYYAVSRALLTALEIDNLEVTRVGGTSSHYWNLVNCGDGWYHFDATPRSSKLPYFVSFMFTDQEAADYTVSVGGGREYYTFDGSLYPERETEKPWETIG